MPSVLNTAVSDASGVAPFCQLVVVPYTGVVPIQLLVLWASAAIGVRQVAASRDASSETDRNDGRRAPSVDDAPSSTAMA